MTQEQVMTLIRQVPQLIAEYILSKDDFEVWGKERMDIQRKEALQAKVAAGKEAEIQLAKLEE
jgi:hypothetical protein